MGRAFCISKKAKSPSAKATMIIYYRVLRCGYSEREGALILEVVLSAYQSPIRTTERAHRTPENIQKYDINDGMRGKQGKSTVKEAKSERMGRFSATF